MGRNGTIKHRELLAAEIMDGGSNKFSYLNFLSPFDTKNKYLSAREFMSAAKGLR